MQKKDSRIENIRAFAIVVVVLGHSIIVYSNSWGVYSSSYSVPLLDWVKRLINLIQMPLYFALSGYLFSRTKEKTWLTLFVEKIKRLMIPFAIFACVYVIPIRQIINYPACVDRAYIDIVYKDMILGQDSGHLWFLPCLFLCFVFAKLVHEITLKLGWRITGGGYYVVNFIISAILFCLVICFPEMNSRVIHLNNAFRYYLWFSLGLLINYEPMNALITKIRKHPYFVAGMMIVFTSLIMSYPGVYNIMYSACFIIAAFSCFPIKSTEAIKSISKNSFGIYLLHSPLVYITYSQLPYGHPCVVVTLNLLFALLCYALTIMLSKTKMYWIIGNKQVMNGTSQTK